MREESESLRAGKLKAQTGYFPYLILSPADKGFLPGELLLGQEKVLCQKPSLEILTESDRGYNDSEELKEMFSS